MSHISKRLKEAKGTIDKNKAYPVAEAIDLAKKTATTKFVGSIEIHINVAIDPRQSDQIVRGQVKLPHGTGKTVRVVAFVSEAKEADAKAAGAEIVGGEELIKEIQQTGKTDFDVAVATPDMMPKLAQIAKILGPRGLMPNPRTGTVSPDVTAAITEIKAGRIDFKNDATGNVHGVIGKSDLTAEQLVENFNVFFTAISQAKPAGLKKQYIRNITVNATMGPGIKVSA